MENNKSQSQVLALYQENTHMLTHTHTHTEYNSEENARSIQNKACSNCICKKKEMKIQSMAKQLHIFNETHMQTPTHI